MRSVWIAGVLLASRAHADVAQLDGTFDATTLVFRLDLRSTSPTVKKLARVGVESDVVGDFKCMPFHHKSPALADYIVRFHVKTPATLIAAAPALTLDPGATVGFTVTLVPDDTGACGAWRSTVRIVAVLDDGTTVRSTPATLTHAQAHTAGERRLPASDVAAAARHADVGMRSAAADRAGDADLPLAEARQLLPRLIDDPEPAVRFNAVEAISKRKLTELGPKVMALFERERARLKPERKANAEVSSGLLELARGLGGLREPAAVRPVVGLLLDERMEYANQLDGALATFRLPAIVDATREVVRRRPSWAMASAPVDQQSRYATALRTLVRAADRASLPLLTSLLADRLVERAADDILWALVALHQDKDASPEQRAFVTAMAPALGRALAHQTDYYWGQAIILLLDLPGGRAQLTRELLAYQLASARDRSAPAVAALELGFTELFPRVCANDGYFVKRLRTAQEKAGATCPR